jgi:hypothetical protein
MASAKSKGTVGVVGLGIMGLARWFALGRKRIEETALKKQIGELR